MGVPQIGWFIVETPITMDDDWGYPHFNNSACVLLYLLNCFMSNSCWFGAYRCFSRNKPSIQTTSKRKHGILWWFLAFRVLGVLQTIKWILPIAIGKNQEPRTDTGISLVNIQLFQSFRIPFGSINGDQPISPMGRRTGRRRSSASTTMPRSEVPRKRNARRRARHPKDSWRRRRMWCLAVPRFMGTGNGMEREWRCENFGFLVLNVGNGWEWMGMIHENYWNILKSWSQQPPY